MKCSGGKWRQIGAYTGVFVPSAKTSGTSTVDAEQGREPAPALPEDDEPDEREQWRQPAHVGELLDAPARRKRLTRSSQPAWNISTWSSVRPSDAFDSAITVSRIATPAAIPATAPAASHDVARRSLRSRA